MTATVDSGMTEAGNWDFSSRPTRQYRKPHVPRTTLLPTVRYFKHHKASRLVEARRILCRTSHTTCPTCLTEPQRPSASVHQHIIQILSTKELGAFQMMSTSSRKACQCAHSRLLQTSNKAFLACLASLSASSFLMYALSAFALYLLLG